MYTVGNLKDSISGILAGTNLDKITGLNNALERAVRTLLQHANIPEASAKQQMMLYDGVFDYIVDTSIFGSAVVDLRPQGDDRSPMDTVTKRHIVAFDQTKHFVPSGAELTFEYNKGVPIVRIASARTPYRVILDNMKETTDWVAGGSLGSLAKDQTVYYESPSALRFTLTGASTGTLTKTLPNAISIAAYENVAVGFLALRIPDGATAADLTSIAVKVGSSASAYNEVTTTSGFLGAWTAGEYILVAFDFSAATTTGTPDWTAINYMQLSFAHTATLTNVRVGGFWLALPTPYELMFQSSAIFLRNGVLSKAITDDDDEIILNDAAYLLLENQGALTVAEQSSGFSPKTLSGLMTTLHAPTTGLYTLYRADNPSEELRVIGSYY